jgi:hypothetical protein
MKSEAIEDIKKALVALNPRPDTRGGVTNRSKEMDEAMKYGDRLRKHFNRLSLHSIQIDPKSYGILDILYSIYQVASFEQA